MHAGTLDELSSIMARELLGAHSGSSTPRVKSLEQSQSVPRQDRGGTGIEQSEEVDERSGSKKSHAAVLEKTQKLSLDELRTNHDAQAMAISASRTTSTELETKGGMPIAAELWMFIAGILEWRSLVLSRLWGFILLALTLAASGVLLWFTGTEDMDAPTAATTLCYMFGVAVSIFLLRGKEVQELVGKQRGNLDMYAKKCGFLREWRKMSKRRFFESLGFLIIMCSSRWLGYSQNVPVLPDLLPNLAFCFAASGFAGIGYLQLHILSGLELAIDSFSINFFRIMHMEDALAEWNVVQATLRHVSTKLSKSLLVLGTSCCMASMLSLVHVAFVRTDIVRGLPLIVETFWLLPPVVFFLYAMMRAACVTEKASRVAPLVNSWTFESHEPGHEGEIAQWMDLGRQYLVQYINQSEAGFYIQGVRLRIFQVTKVCYYVGAILFAVVTRILGWSRWSCATAEELITAPLLVNYSSERHFGIVSVWAEKSLSWVSIYVQIIALSFSSQGSSRRDEKPDPDWCTLVPQNDRLHVPLHWIEDRCFWVF